jgi:hypothetical protein
MRPFPETFASARPDATGEPGDMTTPVISFESLLKVRKGAADWKTGPLAARAGDCRPYRTREPT